MTFGSVHGPGAAHGYMLNKYLERARVEGKSLKEMGKILVDEYLDAGRPVMGIGQPQHIHGDPRAMPTHNKQRELGLEGVYLELQLAIEEAFDKRRKAEGKRPIGVNVVGAGNTALSELGFSPNAAWAIGCICRGFSCACHAIENMKRGRAWMASRGEKMVQMLDLSMIVYDGIPDRQVPPQEEREAYARKELEKGAYKKWTL